MARAKRIATGLAALFLIWLTACGSEPNHIVGDWTAVDVREDGDSMRLVPDQVGFTFTEDGRYQYRSTLKYREAGHYRIEADRLIATDTTQAQAQERVTQILLLKPDSLRLRMRQDSTLRTILLLR